MPIEIKNIYSKNGDYEGDIVLLIELRDSFLMIEYGELKVYDSLDFNDFAWLMIEGVSFFEKGYRLYEVAYYAGEKSMDFYNAVQISERLFLFIDMEFDEMVCGWRNSQKLKLLSTEEIVDRIQGLSKEVLY